jgi:diguanylate cyclase
VATRTRQGVEKAPSRSKVSLALGAAVIAAAGVAALVAWVEGGASTIELADLWRLSLQSWSSVKSDADGGVIKVVHEPLAIFRDLSLISICFTAGFVAVGNRGSSADDGAHSIIETTTEHLDAELVSITRLVESYLEKSKRYSSVLREGQAKLTTSNSPDQLKAAIRILISENQRMTEETAEHEQHLAASRAQIGRLQATLAETRHLSERDTLTSCYNRRYFDEALAASLEAARRERAPVCLVLADIDHFKKINDQYGHLIGDEVVKLFAEHFNQVASKSDTVARFGGDEFAIIMPDKSLEQAKLAVRKILEWSNQHHWTVKGVHQIGKLTASFGVSQWRQEEDAAQLMSRADANLYMSKSRGRNRVVADGDAS